MNWYEINNSVKNKLEISIEEEIGGWGVNAKDFIDEVKNSGATEVELLINSGGGSVIDALAIYDFLTNSPIKVSVKILGLAASAATIIALAADEKPVITLNSFFMIHNPWQGVDVWKGMDAEEMRELADDLVQQAEVMEKFTTKLVNIYIKASGLSDSKVRELMDADTWMTAEEARDFGFVSDDIEGAIKIAAFASIDSLEKRGYKNVPKNYVSKLNQVNMSDKNEKGFFELVKNYFAPTEGGETPKAEAKPEEVAAALTAQINEAVAKESEAINAKLNEAIEAKAKADLEIKASAEELAKTKADLDKANSSRGEGTPKADSEDGKTTVIKDELGEHIIRVFKASGH